VNPEEVTFAIGLASAAAIGFALGYVTRRDHLSLWLAAIGIVGIANVAWAMTDAELDKIAATAVPAAVIGFGFGLASGYLVRKYGSFGEWLRGLIAAIVVAVLVALGIDDTGWSVTLKSVVVAVSAFLAPDILEGLIQLATMLKSDPIGFYRRVRAALRGTPDEPIKPPEEKKP
jgi:hypothetical protein